MGAVPHPPKNVHAPTHVSEADASSPTRSRDDSAPSRHRIHDCLFVGNRGASTSPRTTSGPTAARAISSRRPAHRHGPILSLACCAGCRACDRLSDDAPRPLGYDVAYGQLASKLLAEGLYPPGVEAMIDHRIPKVVPVSATHASNNMALHDRGCSWGLNPPASSRDLATVCRPRGYVDRPGGFPGRAGRDG